MAAVTYSEAPEVADVAQPLIDTIHTHLTDVPIRYVFRSEAAVSKGHQVWGKARIVTGLNAHLAGPIIAGGETWDRLFVIEIAHDVWEVLDDRKRSALVDHELSHCWADDDKLTLLGHDVEEFAGVVRRWGLWRESLKGVAEALKSA